MSYKCLEFRWARDECYGAVHGNNIDQPLFSSQLWILKSCTYTKFDFYESKCSEKYSVLEDDKIRLYVVGR